METGILSAPGKGAMEEMQLVTFQLEEEEFGFDIMSVQEIIRLPKMAKVPRTPAYVDGIANLRGVVLPIIDVRSRFGMERAEETDRTRVLVIDINGVKTGLRVDRVKQVTRVSRNEIDAPPAAIRGATADYLDGVVRLDNGQRIIMSLNAAHVCELKVDSREPLKDDQRSSGQPGEDAAAGQLAEAAGREDLQQMVTFRVGEEEFAFSMERVREILRVSKPKQVPDAPDYVLGVLTVRGRILPIIDLRRLLHQPSLAEQVKARAAGVREEYRAWITSLENRASMGAAISGKIAVAERLRAWMSSFNSSSESLMEALSGIRALNDRLMKNCQQLVKTSGGAGKQNGELEREIVGAGNELLAAMARFETYVDTNIQEDQRIVVVDSGGVPLGLVVDHVSEVLNVPKRLMDPPPAISGAAGIELSGIAKLNDGSRLVMLLDVARLIDQGPLQHVAGADEAAGSSAVRSEAMENRNTVEANELQLVTFLLGREEYGIPIAQIQEIDRLSRITRTPKAAAYVEGVTNLRGEVIPVIDTRKRFDLEVRAADDRTRVIIVELDGVKTGLIVDSVREVMSLSRQDIAAPPAAIASGVDQKFISGIGKVDGGKRMIVLLDVAKILSRQGQETGITVQ
jgi:purine-binding chemotaxis protein CheW